MIVHQDFKHKGRLPPKEFLEQIADYKTCIYMMLWELRDNENVSRVNWDDLSPTHHMNSFNSALRKLHSSGLVQSVEKNGTVYEISLVDWEDINAHIEG